jgi:hypothetical protein
MNPAPYAPISPTSLQYPSFHFTTLLGDLNIFTFPSVHHIYHFPNPLSKSVWFAGGVSKISAGNRFQNQMVLFTKEYNV